MNKTIITILSIIVVMIAIFTSILIYKQNNNNQNEDSIVTKVADENILDECTDEYEEIQNKMIEANSDEDKISPNCFITLKVTYKNCGHQTNEYINVPENLVNKSKDELQEQYSDWDIEEFSDTQIVLAKEEVGECGEHFLVQDRDGNVVVYKILEDGSKKEYEQTDISTEYLSESDKLQIKDGIRINGKQALNQFIEDFE